MLKKAVGMAVVDQRARRRTGARSGSGTGGSCATCSGHAGRTGTRLRRTAKPAGGGQKVGQTGNPDPGVNFLNVVENPHVRVLQVTLQPGAVRRPHVHNDVTFHMLVPITGSLELTVEKDPVVTTVPGTGLLHGEGADAQLHEQDGGGRAGDRTVHQAGSGHWPRRLRRLQRRRLPHPAPAAPPAK